MPSTSQSASQEFVNIQIPNEITESDGDNLTRKSTAPKLDAVPAATSSRVSMAELNISSDTLNEVDEQDFAFSRQDSPQFAYRTSSPVPETSKTQSSESLPIMPNQKSYDYLLKVLLVGDSDVGKELDSFSMVSTL